MWSRVISFLYEKIVIPSQIHVCMYICTSELYFSKNCNFLDQDLCLCLWHPFNALIQISKSNFYTRDPFSGSSQNWRSSIFTSLKRKNKTSFIKTLAKRVVNSSISKICIKKRTWNLITNLITWNLIQHPARREFEFHAFLAFPTMQFSFNRLLIFENFPDIPANEILELFGRMFFEFCQDSGYDKILQVLGATPRDFLQVNLPRAATIHFLTE